MNCRIILFWAMIICSDQKVLSQVKNRITIKIVSDQLKNKDSAFIYFNDPKDLSRETNFVKADIVNNSATFNFTSVGLINLYTRSIIKGYRTWISEPGDSIVIKAINSTIFISGKGADKYRLLTQVDSTLKTIPQPANNNKYLTLSIDDFLETDLYLRKQLNKVLPLIDSYKKRLSISAYNTIRVNIIASNHKYRLDKFASLLSLSNRDTIIKKRLPQIFDSCFYTQHWSWVLSKPDYAPGWYAFIRTEVARKYNFNYQLDSLKSRELRKFLYYDQGKRTYKGLSQQRFLLTLITDETMDEIGFTQQTEKLIERYYAEPGYPEFKEYAKAYEAKLRKLTTGKEAPSFTLWNSSGKKVQKDDYIGKVVLLDFWFTGCKGCVEMVPAIKRLEEEFKGDTNLVFLSVSIDKEKAKWVQSIKEAKYTTGTGDQVFTGGEGDSHRMIKEYSISGYPALFLIDGQGKIAGNPLPDPRSETRYKELKELMQKNLMLLNDGPYVMHSDQSVKQYTVQGTSVISKEISKEGILSVQSEEYQKRFDISLKNDHKIEQPEYSRPSKLFVLSDIEGNLEAFRKLLVSNGIIDSSNNWTFGKGHLVFAGDMFDRGNQVTECLWLMYSLEEKAKATGGYVHFVLGNHEIMNLSGDTRYVKEKYHQNAELLGMSYIQLYSSNSELGRWLRTKNIVEKIGDLLFLHGGISPEVNSLPLTLTELNAHGRPFYDRTSLARNSTDLTLQTIYNNKTSPFWYRLYYLDAPIKYYPTDTLYKTSVSVVDQTLRKFGVNHIVTGHTIVADTISVHYDGKVINTDTKHAGGKSEALLIEGDRFYRVNAEGKRVLLFIDDKNKKISQLPKN